jgi:integrase
MPQQQDSGAGARKLPEIARKFVVWEGRKIPLIRERGIWRLRSRTKHLRLDVSLGVGTEPAARTRAKELLSSGIIKESQPGRGTAEEIATIYLATPKRTAAVTAKANVSRFRAVVQTVHGKSLTEFPVASITAKLWTDFQSARLAALGETLDYSKRRRENIGLNAIVRAARCLFIRRLRPAYEAAGVRVPADADTVTWLPEPILVKPPADDAGLVAAWRALPRDGLYFAIGLARFAGLRRDEILHCRREWIVDAAGAVTVELRDRLDQGWQTKTGLPYSAPVIDPEFAAALLAVPAGSFVVQPDTTDRARWIERGPQAWCRTFVGQEVIKPLHRLRALYATALQERTRAAVLASLAGAEAAQHALGHTTQRTTRRHYL